MPTLTPAVDLTPAEWAARATPLTPEQEAEIETIIFVEATRCVKGDPFEVHANVDGTYRLARVVAKTAPYKAPFGQGRMADYVDVYGYDTGRATFLLGKLLVKACRYEPEQNHIANHDILVEE